MVLVIAVACSGIAHADPRLEATALFDQATKDLEAGRVDQACKELASSLAMFDDSGTRGVLAKCYTKQGRVASAWLIWHDLADTAPTQDRKTDAASNAKQLELRLPRFVVRVQGAPPPGMSVVVNGAVIDPTLGVALPIDPGVVAVTATAPGLQPWTQSYQAVEGQQLAIEVPALASGAAVAAVPVQPAAAPAAPASAPSDTPVYKKWYFWLAVGAGAVLGFEVVGHLTASSTNANAPPNHRVEPPAGFTLLSW